MENTLKNLDDYGKSFVIRLSNLHMKFFETKTLKNFLPKNAIWFICVDDIIWEWLAAGEFAQFHPTF